MRLPKPQLAEGWRSRLRRGSLAVAEISVPAEMASPQGLAEAFRATQSGGAFFFLETQGAALSAKRFSLMAGAPLFTLLGRGKRAVAAREGSVVDLRLPPEQAFARLGRQLQAGGLSESSPGLLPLVGTLGYEAGARFEELPSPKREPLGLPDWYWILPGEWAWLDPELGCWRFRLLLAEPAFYELLNRALEPVGSLSDEFPITDVESLLGQWASLIEERLRRAARSDGKVAPAPQSKPRALRISDSFDKKRYIAAIKKAQRYIAAGDSYQVNLSHRQSCPWDGDAWALYRRLSRVNPSPFGAFADMGDWKLVSGSPERLFSQDGDRVQTQPIAGTAPRKDGGPRELAALRASVKDRAEHVMLVDLERNDLGRVCVPGSVKVTDLLAVESYSHVHHLVSRVEGRLRKGKDFDDLLAAGFPGGTITGAPKIRSQQIIAELEGERRGLYTGGLGYWDPIHRRADLNILIRSVVLAKDKAHWQVGGGIVADSVPEREWEETLHKAAALKLALETA